MDLKRSPLWSAVTAMLLGAVIAFYPAQLSTYFWKEGLVLTGLLTGLLAWKYLVAVHLPSTRQLTIDQRIRMLLPRSLVIAACVIGMCLAG